jgi:hypothetical protein
MPPLGLEVSSINAGHFAGFVDVGQMVFCLVPCNSN